MRYCEYDNAGYIVCVGTGAGGKEITKERYDVIMSAIDAKPPRTETTDYRLREDLTWEEYPIDPPDPDPEIDDSELLEILMGGAT